MKPRFYGKKSRLAKKGGLNGDCTQHQVHSYRTSGSQYCRTISGEDTPRILTLETVNKMSGSLFRQCNPSVQYSLIYMVSLWRELFNLSQNSILEWTYSSHYILIMRKINLALESGPWQKENIHNREFPLSMPTSCTVHSSTPPCFAYSGDHRERDWQTPRNGN